METLIDEKEVSGDTGNDHMGLVLVVDDQPLNVKLLAGYLESTGYEVMKAYSGEEAIHTARDTQPDIILLDIMMPGMNGFEVTEHLKKEPETAMIPIVLVTALEGAKEKERGLDAGADDFLTKPVNRTELLARTRSLVKLSKLQEKLKHQAERGGILPAAPPQIADEIPEKRRILIVEDEVNAIKYFTHILESSGYQIISATNCVEARQLMDNEQLPDIVLLDLMLGNCDGLELLKQWRSDTKTIEVPVIIVSSLDDLKIKVKGLDTGADDYLVKPINITEMQARIRAVLRKSDLKRRLNAQLSKTFQDAITDSLTGLYNRQYLATVFDQQVAYARRHQEIFSLLILDIDYFKKINDTFGHLVGDAVLKKLAEIMQEATRDEDVVCRFGGEEFLIMLAHTSIDGAMIFANRLREAVAAHVFPELDGRTITVSIGVTGFQPEDHIVDDMVKRADDGLYEAKKTGRNRVVLK